MSISMTNESEVLAVMAEIQKIYSKHIKRCLSYLGESCVVRIRDRAPDESWIDHTGNLRSSIGYAIYDHGRKYLASAFGVVKKGSEGSGAGKEYVDSLAKDYANIYALVVAAGMSYAEYVESCEGKDVLASTKIWAESVMDRYMKKAIDDSEREINSLIK